MEASREDLDEHEGLAQESEDGRISISSLCSIPTENEKLAVMDEQDLRPLWVSVHRHVYLETFSPLFIQARDFLITISEPVSRPKYMHEYRITQHTLYTAMSLGLSADGIISVLSRLSKIDLPQQVISFIQENTLKYGKVRIALRNNRYFLHVKDIETHNMIFADSEALSAVISNSPGKESRNPSENGQVEDRSSEGLDWFPGVIEIYKSRLDSVRKRCSTLGLPLLEEYDFRADDNAAKLEIDLKPSTRLRPYQETSLTKMFCDGYARSGIIVLPCGAGKTLVGVAAVATIKKSCLVLCASNVSVQQWANEFFAWSNIRLSQLSKFTPGEKDFINQDAGVIILTYSMVSYTGKRSYEAKNVMDIITSREWGLLILDEVHVVPADMFRSVLVIVDAHSKLGLTATFVREDKKIDSLNYLVGPKLYEADWLSLADMGYIARAQCAEVWCPMTKEFYREYLRGNARQRQLLYATNPNKIKACQCLLDKHTKRGDKTIVFSDNIFALKHYAEKLSLPYIYGRTSNSERIRVLENFRSNPAVNAIFISKIGDTSIDLPEAACLIQISSTYGSRRQEAQRLGRILRSKPGQVGKHNAYFYSLISNNTEEMSYSIKRRKFLMNQGYSIKIITSIETSDTKLVYSTLREQLDLLNTVLIVSESHENFEEFDNTFDSSSDSDTDSDPFIINTSNSLQAFSGGDSMAYMEYNTGTTSNLSLDLIQDITKSRKRRSRQLKNRSSHE